MEHPPAYALKLVACHCKHEYGAREVEDMGILRMLELCARQGKTGAGFWRPISDNAIRYLHSIGYTVIKNEDNTEFSVSFERAIVPMGARFSIVSPESKTSVLARLKQVVIGKSKIG